LSYQLADSKERKPAVSKVCQVSKTRRNKANDICFSNKKHRNFQQPNLQNKKFWDAESKRWVTLRVTTKVIKTITKFGLKGALKRYGTNLNETLK
jgi:large subunit ribosomal protein L28